MSNTNTPKILVIRTCAIGDFVLNIPALIGLQKMHPHARFTLVGNPSTLNLAKEFVPIDSVHSIDVQPWSRLFYESIPDLPFDRAIVWMKDSIVAEKLSVSGISDVFRADPFPAFGHAADHLLRSLHLVRPELPDQWHPATPNIAVHTRSGSAKKNWPYFEELMSRLPEARPIPRNLSLRELARYLRECRAFIGNDSGITHLAAYLGCPTIALFGPTDPRMWGPIGRRVRILWRNKLEDISVDEVVEILRGQGLI